MIVRFRVPNVDRVQLCLMAGVVGKVDLAEQLMGVERRHTWVDGAVASHEP